MSPGQRSLSAPQEDGVSQGQNSNAANGEAPEGVAVGGEEWRGDGELRLRTDRRAKRAKVKRGMRSIAAAEPGDGEIV